MTHPLFWISLVISLVDWLAVANNWRKLEYVAKPAVMLALLAWMLVAFDLRGPLAWFALGILFSLAGDIFLMLPRERFRLGLVAFLLAHLSYIVGLNFSPPPVTPASMLLVLVVLLASLQIARSLLSSLSGEQSSLHKPVLIYSAVITMMLISALLALMKPAIPGYGALLLSAGALLFYLSDTLLAWNRFVSPIPDARIKVIVSYHLGQIGLLVGAIASFVN